MCEIDWSGLGSMISAFAALIAIIYGYKQFKKLNQSLNDSNMMKVFEIEFELNRRKEKCSEILNANTTYIYDLQCHHLEEARRSGSSNEIVYKLHEKEQIKRMQKHYEEAHDNYLNAFERICDLILSKKMEEEDFKTHYFPTLRILMERHSDKFSENSPFKNMITLYNKWKN